MENLITLNCPKGTLLLTLIAGEQEAKFLISLFAGFSDRSRFLAKFELVYF